MSPKKKAKNTVKKNAEKISGEDELENKYRRSVLDIAILQDHIALQRESVKSIQSERAELKRRVRDMEHKLAQEQQDHRDVTSDLGRQRRTMQAELTDKVKALEEEVGRLKEELAQCQEELSRERRERELMEEEKESALADLQHKLDNMETDYEKILHESLDGLASQLPAVRRGAECKSVAHRPNYQELLCEFGLKALDI
ncbi:dynein regulatory complex protein 12 [Nelusetta ayraudi]|uniref:dynein regulatory complex protein 12 n=1 Tax=Nelusetta ayraudi TaxID=303726 RepID=UPI003F72C6B6